MFSRVPTKCKGVTPLRQSLALIGDRTHQLILSFCSTSLQRMVSLEE